MLTSFSNSHLFHAATNINQLIRCKMSQHMIHQALLIFSPNSKLVHQFCSRLLNQNMHPLNITKIFTMFMSTFKQIQNTNNQNMHHIIIHWVTYHILHHVLNVVQIKLYRNYSNFVHPLLSNNKLFWPNGRNLSCLITSTSQYKLIFISL